MEQQTHEQGRVETKAAARQPKVVAELPEDQEIREKLAEQRQNDGFPGSCGGL